MNDIFTAQFLGTILRIAVPIVLAALGGCFSAQVNVFNIGLEGIMLAGAFFGFAASNATGSVWLGFAAGIGAGAIAGLVLGFVIIILKADEVVAGIATNLAWLGLTATLLNSWYHTAGSYLSTTAGTVGSFGDALSHVPVVGPVLGQLDPVILFTALALVVVTLFTYRTSHGLRMRAIGISEKAASAAGVGTTSYKFLAFVLGGVLCGIGGAYLPLSSLSLFSNNMTNGLGFVALAAVIMSGGRPLIAAAAAFFFAIASAFGIQLQSSGLPNEVVLALPYLAAIVAVAWRARSQHRKKAALTLDRSIESV